MRPRLGLVFEREDRKHGDSNLASLDATVLIPRVFRCCYVIVLARKEI